MKNNTPALIILSIFAVIGGMAFNFQEFLKGSPATIKNLIVTFVYIAIWIFVLTISIKNKNRGTLMYCFIFWIITLFLLILTGYIKVTGVPVYWVLPFVILLLGPWYGINFFVESFLTVSVIMAVISIKRTKQV